MPIELILRALFKFMGVNEEQMQETFTKGQAIIIDAHAQIVTMNARLARIERHLGISETNETKALTDGRE